eukprot:TRINITY_DN14819_c0_g1_i8.p1 TRINITY_DN14819_c0_g1~~TRINITY_DN14819_c0_g1_i8.p1  ORF type:complete len:244 (-),score=44.47 TRINITY_DN14819_c0_g1_i8:60-791(-)
MSDRRAREYGKLLISKGGRLWIFYWTNSTVDSPCGYVMRSPGSSLFSQEVILPIKVTQISPLYAETPHSHVVSIYFSSSKLNKNFKYYTTNNAISWEGPVEVTYCGPIAERMHRFPFNSYLTPGVVFLGCKGRFRERWLSKSYDGGETWEKISGTKELDFAKFALDGGRDNNGVFGYAAGTVYYMGLKDKELREMGYPPTPTVEKSEALTSSYKLRSFWFWYMDFHKNTFWVTRGDMELKLNA